MNPLRILIIEDDEQVGLVLQEHLSREGYDLMIARDGRAALNLLETYIFDAAMIDINLPDMTGIAVLEAAKRRDAGLDAVMMTGYPQVETAVQALRLGAYDYLIKPIEFVSLKHMLKRIVERRYLRSEVTTLRTRLAETAPLGDLVGSSEPMSTLKGTIATVAATDSTVLLEGESGTGKELIAGAIHRLSPRRNGPFVAVNCSAIPGELIESELFGHQKGSFSGASGDYRGLFRSAEKGTLLLDEIGELPVQMQPKLLRVLQEREVRPVGSAQIHKLDVRVIASTNQNLESLMNAGRFRQDLFFRLNVVRLEPPVLRGMKEDIHPLVMHFVRKLNRQFGRQVGSVAPAAMAALLDYDFPGNIRELQNIIERAYALGANNQITLSDLPSLPAARSRTAVAAAAAPAATLNDLERDLIASTLRANGNDKKRAAEALSLSERTLYRRLKKLGLN